MGDTWLEGAGAGTDARECGGAIGLASSVSSRYLLRYAEDGIS